MLCIVATLACVCALCCCDIVVRYAWVDATFPRCAGTNFARCPSQARAGPMPPPSGCLLRGRRQRAERDAAELRNAGVAEPGPLGHLAYTLLHMWAWGSLSATKLQGLAADAVKDCCPEASAEACEAWVLWAESSELPQGLAAIPGAPGNARVSLQSDGCTASAAPHTSWGHLGGSGLHAPAQSVLPPA